MESINQNGEKGQGGGSILSFSFQTAPVRVVMQDGEPWWIAADVCAVLELGNPRQAITRLDEDEKSTVISNDGGPDRNIINESGLYSLVMGSRKPEAKAFKKWITSEVIPSIRKTGGYGRLNPANLSRLQLLEMAMQAEQERLALSTKVNELEPKAMALDLISTRGEGSICITDAAKNLQVNPKRLFLWLQEHEWIYRRAGGASWIAYQNRLQQGLLEHKVTTVSRQDGTEKVIEQVLVTPKGLARLSSFFVATTEEAM